MPVKSLYAANAGQSWHDLATLRAPVRLGAEVFLSGRLAPASIGQACDALREFSQEMDRWKVDAYRAIATSAVSEAKNGGTLVERARREAGIELEAIEGIEEARLIQFAVTRRLAAGRQARPAGRRGRRLDGADRCSSGERRRSRCRFRSARSGCSRAT